MSCGIILFILDSDLTDWPKILGRLNPAVPGIGDCGELGDVETGLLGEAGFGIAAGGGWGYSIS